MSHYYDEHSGKYVPKTYCFIDTKRQEPEISLQGSNYKQWHICNDTGEHICSLYGHMSGVCAAAVVAALNEGKIGIDALMKEVDKSRAEGF